MKQEDYVNWVWLDTMRQLLMAGLCYLIPLLAYWHFIG